MFITRQPDANANANANTDGSGDENGGGEYADAEADAGEPGKSAGDGAVAADDAAPAARPV